MNLVALIPWVVVAIVAFIALRLVIGAVKSSMKMMLWVVVLLAAGFGWLWWQSQNPSNIAPNSSDAPLQYSEPGF